MEQIEMLAGHVRDLKNRCMRNDYLTYTSFLSEAERVAIFDQLRREGEDMKEYLGNAASCLSFGGREEAERQVLCFLPSYMEKNRFLEEEQRTAEGTVIALLHVLPKNHRFSEPLSHRDYLGSLMQLGLEREKIGDILVQNAGADGSERDEAYLYVMAESADLIASELTRVKHTSVVCTRVPLDACRISVHFEELSGSVASERLDAILAMVYRLSRGKAQELVNRELVQIDGRTAFSPGYDLKPGQKVSVRGHGKFVYDGTGAVTKKGRMYAKVRLYR